MESCSHSPLASGVYKSPAGEEHFNVIGQQIKWKVFLAFVAGVAYSSLNCPSNFVPNSQQFWTRFRLKVSLSSSAITAFVLMYVFIYFLHAGEGKPGALSSLGS